MSLVPLVGSSLSLASLVLVRDPGAGSRLADLGTPTSRSPSLPARRRVMSPRRRREALVEAEIEVPSSLALELRAGREVGPALLAVGQQLDSFADLAARLRHAAAVAAAGGDVGSALSGGGAGGPDQIGGALRVTGACCSAAVSSGMALAELLEAAASSARSRSALRGMARAELAAARSTAVVLAVLPAVGVAMGTLLGGRPLQVLFGTVWGAGCLLAALLLNAAGLLWLRAITQGLQRAMP
jgi:tight adherence protein B